MVALATLWREQQGGGDFSACNQLLEACAATRWAVEECRSGEGPVFLPAETLAMGGHATQRRRAPPKACTGSGRRPVARSRRRFIHSSFSFDGGEKRR